MTSAMTDLFYAARGYKTFRFKGVRLPSNVGDPEGDFYLDVQPKSDCMRLVESVNRAVGKRVLDFNNLAIIDVKIHDKDAWSSYISNYVDGPDEKSGLCTLRLPKVPTRRELQ
jgi:hypothetical protein